MLTIKITNIFFVPETLWQNNPWNVGQGSPDFRGWNEETDLRGGQRRRKPTHRLHCGIIIVEDTQLSPHLSEEEREQCLEVALELGVERYVVQAESG